MPVSHRLRPAVRVVLLDPDDHALLVRWEFADRHVWGTPGGGIDPGETHEDAVRRELREETGLVLPPGRLGAPVGRRTHVFSMRTPDGQRFDGQTEWYYLVRVERFDPRGSLSDAELRAESLHELRWVRLAEVADLVDEAAVRPVVTAPRMLGALLHTLATDGPPAEPHQLDV